MLNYNQALDFIHGLNAFGTKLGLENITKLLEILGNPHKDMKIIHVAGTNGKGSTCAMIDSILRSDGYKVGLYTSPYLEVFNERIQVNGKNISDDDLARLTDKVQKAVFYMRENNIGSPTEFEVVTAIGFLYFYEQTVDFLVLEVGMGGRLDATNVVTPLVSVITPISFDHQEYLGNTLSAIAKEKCGIIKPGVPVVTSPQEPEALQVIEETCKNLNCRLLKVIGEESISKDFDLHDTATYKLVSDNDDGLIFDLKTPAEEFKNLEIHLIGRHQLSNAATAVTAVDVLNMHGIDIKREAIYAGLKNARWPGRLERISQKPLILIDGAHNIAGIKTLKDALIRYYKDKKKILVLGILKDKDYKEMLKEIVPIADVVITTAPLSPRALNASELACTICEMLDEKTIEINDNDRQYILPGKVPAEIPIYSREKIEDALNLALSLINSKEDMIVFAGSLYMIGYARTLIKDRLASDTMTSKII